MMRKEVINLNDLQEMAPFFRSRFGTLVGKGILKMVCIDKVNRAHANNCHLRGADFTAALLKDPLINISYTVHNEEILDNLPPGAFITVSNHPIGSLDGIILIDIFASRRPDFKVMVNGVLARIGAMEDNFISVVPDSYRKGANTANINGIRLSLKHLKEGHPTGFFPAGSISFYSKEARAVQDLSWAHSVIRLIRKTKVCVFPVYFDFLNTRFFYWLGEVDWRVRTLRIPAEIFNKKNQHVNVYLGDPIRPEEISQYTDDNLLADFLYQRTYSAKRNR